MWLCRRPRSGALPTRATCRHRAISSATTEKISDGLTPRATRVATRRNAACCSASTASSSRLAFRSARVAALAIAVATRSAKSAMRASVSGGIGSGRLEPTIAAPHSRPSTTIGTPTTEWMPSARMRAASGPDASSWLSIRAARPVCSTLAPTLSPASGMRSPVTGIFVIPGSY